MNCEQVNPLLPLYVGLDLEEKHSRLVAAHLQSCMECARDVDEYSHANQLLQAYEPPVFGDETYAAIRRRVLNEIERRAGESISPSLFSQFLSVLVQPRMRWITVAVLLAISATGLYLSRNPFHQQSIDRQAADSGRTVESSPENINNSASSTPPSKKDFIAGTHTRFTRKKKVGGGVVAINPPRHSDKITKVDPPTNDRLVQPDVNLALPSSGPAPLRVEMQTSDRNIRIIWLSSQRPRAGVSYGSKGT